MTEILANRRRWQAVVTYSTAGGAVDVPHEIEELAEVDAIVERGPDWRSIVSILITYARRDHPMTIEAAALEGKAP